LSRKNFQKKIIIFNALNALATISTPEFRIIIPCHRVVSAKNIGGFCGRINGGSIKIKRWLLNHENKNSII
jgi:hypothetical protein